MLSDDSHTSQIITPSFNLRGSIAEMDSKFFNQIATPMQSASEFVTNQKSFFEELAKVKEDANKKSGKNKGNNEKTSVDKYAEAMKIVDDLEAKGKFKEAWMKVPLTKLFPEHTEEILKRKAALSAKFPPDLFGNQEPKVLSAEEKQNADPHYPYYADGKLEDNEEYEDNEDSETM
jgi:hypothetical protein